MVAPVPPEMIDRVASTSSTLGSLYGDGVARRIEQVSGDRVILNQGTI